MVCGQLDGHVVITDYSANLVEELVCDDDARNAFSPIQIAFSAHERRVAVIFARGSPPGTNVLCMLDRQSQQAYKRTLGEGQLSNVAFDDAENGAIVTSDSFVEIVSVSTLKRITIWTRAHPRLDLTGPLFHAALPLASDSALAGLHEPVLFCDY